MNTSPWTPEEDRLILRHRTRTSWVRVATRTGRTVKQCQSRRDILRAFQRTHGRLPTPGEVESFPTPRRWEPWEDELLRLALRHMIRSHSPLNTYARLALALALRRTREAIRQRIVYLDYDPEELEAL